MLVGAVAHGGLGWVQPQRFQHEKLKLQ